MVLIRNCSKRGNVSSRARHDTDNNKTLDEMELTIGAWFNEPGINFEFSYRISNYIRLAIKECVMTPLGLIDAYPEKFLHLTVTTTSTQDKLEVKMGSFKAKATSVKCGLWFVSSPKNSTF